MAFVAWVICVLPKAYFAGNFAWVPPCTRRCRTLQEEVVVRSAYQNGILCSSAAVVRVPVSLRYAISAARDQSGGQSLFYRL